MSTTKVKSVFELQRELKEVAKQGRAAKRCTKKQTAFEAGELGLNWWDRKLLTACEVAERKAIDLRYKRDDREGWEADKLVDRLKFMVRFMMWKSKALSRPLGERDKKLVASAQAAITVIEVRGIGKAVHTPEFTELKQALTSFVPETNDLMGILTGILAEAQAMAAAAEGNTN